MSSTSLTDAEQQESFERWSNLLTDYIQVFLTLERDVPPQEAEALTFSFVKSLNEILEYAINQNRFKEVWEPTMFMPYMDGLEIKKKATRTGTTFEFGIDPKGFYFQLSPQHIGNLRRMDDEFWKQFLQLSEVGEFDFLVNEQPGNTELPKEERKLRDGKSKLFTLVKTYLLFEFYAEETYPFGDIRVSWPFPYFWEDLLSNLTKAIKIGYNLDYLLWMSTYQKQASKRKSKR